MGVTGSEKHKKMHERHRSPTAKELLFALLAAALIISVCLFTGCRSETGGTEVTGAFSPTTDDGLNGSYTNGDSESPDDTSAPGDSESPEDTSAPDDSETPEDTSAPGDSESPEDTSAPGDSENPDDTSAPGDSENPEDTSAPGDSETPEDTSAPGDSENPEEPDVTYSLSNWMSAVDGETPLSMISIPGTHESCALYEPWPGTAICQTMSISEQLEAGVRYFDIRCKNVKNSFDIYHGIVSQNISFDRVLEQIYAFLDENPTEAVIMCVKEEQAASGSDESFESVLLRYIDKNPERFFTKSSIPSLESVRGKIVLLRRFDGSTGYPAFHGWADNTTFVINNGATSLSVQDYYNIGDKQEKWNSICSFFESALPSPSRYYLNNTSGYTEGLFSIPDITDVSEYINPMLREYLADNDRFLGITACDFMTEEIAELIISANFA